MQVMKSHHSLKPLGFANHPNHPKSLRLSQASQRKTLNVCSLLSSGAQSQTWAGSCAKEERSEMKRSQLETRDHAIIPVTIWIYQWSWNIRRYCNHWRHLWWSLELPEQPWTFHAAQWSQWCLMRFTVPTRSPLALADVQSIIDPFPSMSSTQGFVPCDLHFALSTIEPSLPELVEPGFGRLISWGFFLKRALLKISFSSDQWT